MKNHRYVTLLFLLLTLTTPIILTIATETTETVETTEPTETTDTSETSETTESPDTPETPDTPNETIAQISIQLTQPSRSPAPFPAHAYILPSEDIAIGAFRFAEEYSEFHVPTVLRVAELLSAALPPSYTPPPELTHCGGKRECSAGKLWKRVEESRKADLHDDAGADVVRILRKTGIDQEFEGRCVRMLEWTFDNLRRQRERERREREVEEKLERRRLEEEEAMEEAKARKEENEAEWKLFSQSILTDLQQTKPTTTTVNPDGTTTSESDESEEETRILNLQTSILQSFTTPTPSPLTTTALLKKLPPRAKTIPILLIEARCYEQLGDYRRALSSAGHLIQKAGSYDSWVNGTPRMMAAYLGANAAMQLGLSQNAISFYQTVLKFDPEQETARGNYRGLKKVVKLMDKAEEQIKKGYNKAASDIVDDCLSAMRGLDVDSPLFRSKIQLKQCTILSGMGKHEEALNNCDSAVEVRASSDFVQPETLKEAYLVRSEALLLDMNYDEAVQDLRSAIDLIPEPSPEDSDELKIERRELGQKLQMTMRQQDAWNGGQMDHRFNEHTGFPNGRPPERDHIKILELPIDLEERGKDIKCAWLKKQFKLLVRKFHPDKYKGNKKRAARKFKEVTDSKGHLSDVWGCKG